MSKTDYDGIMKVLIYSFLMRMCLQPWPQTRAETVRIYR